jgi:two-component system cell cycle response regulator/two-component system cell cycle response regulator DivK
MMAHQTVLVVEDNPLNRELVVDLLEGAGYTVLQADEGVGLLERVRAGQPGLILLDLQLPGLDGVTLARQLKADPATREIPVLAMTAYARVEDQERAMEAGCDGYLRKPLDTRALLQTVARHLGRSG